MINEETTTYTVCCDGCERNVSGGFDYRNQAEQWLQSEASESKLHRIFGKRYCESCVTAIIEKRKQENKVETANV